LEDFNVIDSFNYAMAQWGLSSKPPIKILRRVVELYQQQPVESVDRYHWLSIAFWASRDSDKALEQIGEAWQQLVTRPTPVFSYWSYLQVSPDRFLEDLKEIQQLVEGETILPRFIRESQSHR
jgi:hypothetical protein